MKKLPSVSLHLSMKYFRTAAVIFFTFFSANNYAGGWSAWGKVESIVVPPTYGQGRAFYIKLAGISTVDNCSDSTLAVGDINHENVDRQYSLLLTAFASGKDVKVYTEGCIWYPRITMVEVR